MPVTREITSRGWDRFLHAFSKRNQGRPVRLETTVPAGQGEPVIAERQPLLGLDLDRKEGSLPRFGASGSERQRRGRAPAITVTLGGLDAAMPQYTHRIAAPRCIWVEEDADGLAVGLEIESPGEGKMLLLFEREEALPASCGAGR